MGNIFYLHSVVGGVVQKTNDKYGARIHSTWRYVLRDAQSEYEFINWNYGYGEHILFTQRCWW